MYCNISREYLPSFLAKKAHRLTIRLPCERSNDRATQKASAKIEKPFILKLNFSNITRDHPSNELTILFLQVANVYNEKSDSW